jgi:ATP-binding cassette, subfamily B, bacterial
VAGVSTIFLAMAEVARPFPLKLVIDWLLTDNGAFVNFSIGGSEVLFLAMIAGLVLTIAIVDALASYRLALRRAGESVAHSLRVAVYAHLQRLSLFFHDRRHHGDLMTRATGDVQSIGQLFSESLGVVVSAALLLLGMLIVSLILAPALALLTFRFRDRVKTAARRQRAKEGEIASLAAETLSAMREVKALGTEDYEHGRLSQKSKERQEAGLEAARVESRFAGLADVIAALGAALVLVVGVLRVAGGVISPGDLVVMVSYARRIHRPLRDLTRQVGRIARAMARAERVAEVLGADQVLTERPHAHRGPRAKGTLKLASVSFSYVPERPVLQNLSLSIPAGQKVAILGPSGAGKSTVAALLARFYDPTSGQILLDGRNLVDCSLPWLRAQIGLVLQDTVLFTGTVAENIAYGVEADHRDVVRAATAAGAHSFICDLPDGYDTVLGPRGKALSGGQRQRIAVARTLLRDPPVLILDEPTAALDAESEKEVLAGLETLMHGRTTVIITHSPALTQWADRVVALDRGRLVTESSRREVRGKHRRRALQGRSEMSPSEVPKPEDQALPHMAHVLTPEVMAPVLRRVLPDGAPLPEVRVNYLRYKPGTNLVVHYEVTLGEDRHHVTGMITARDYLERRAGKPENVALARLVEGRTPAATPLHYDPKLRCLVQWYPLDVSLPVLAQPPTGLRRRLQAAGIEVSTAAEEPVPLAYKPRRRAVCRLDGHVIKHYAKEDHFHAAAAGLKASTDLPSVIVPKAVGVLPDWRVTVQTLLLGGAPAEPIDLAAQAGAVLSTLHRSRVNESSVSRLPRFQAQDQLDAARASARLVGAVVPALRCRLERLLVELEDTTPAVGLLVLSHGDFNARQLIVVGTELAVTDFDEMCLAPAALDLATFSAYLVRGEHEDLDAALGGVEALLEGYGARPEGLPWYLATMLLRRAPRPFRYMEPGWPQGVKAMVARAEAALHL